MNSTDLGVTIDLNPEQAKHDSATRTNSDSESNDIVRVLEHSKHDAPRTATRRRMLMLAIDELAKQDPSIR
jgi:hypothetical protein